MNFSISIRGRASGKIGNGGGSHQECRKRGEGKMPTTRRKGGEGTRKVGGKKKRAEKGCRSDSSKNSQELMEGFATRSKEGEEGEKCVVMLQSPGNAGGGAA